MEYEYKSEFVDPIYAKNPSPKFKSGVANLDAKREDLIAYLQGLTGEYVNFQIVRSKDKKDDYGLPKLSLTRTWREEKREVSAFEHMPDREEANDSPF